MLPDKDIQRILAKFGPEIKAYLESVGFFDVEGPYDPLDFIATNQMQEFVAASREKNKAVWAKVEEFMFKEMELSSVEFAKAYKLKPVENVSDIADKFFKPEAGKLIKGMTKTDKNKLMSFIWSNSGKNERPLARQILKEPGLSGIVDNSGFRARMIIRTERHTMTWGSSVEFAVDAGSETKGWVTVGDGRVRNPHRALNGEIVLIREPFSNKLQYPSEPNCRCHLVYGFDKALTRSGIQAFTKTPPPYIGLSEKQLSELYS